MCQNAVPAEPTGVPSGRTFTTTEELLNAIQPGMELCTSDFTGWASVESVTDAVDGRPLSVRGRRHDDGQLVDVPADVLIDIRGGHCVRIDRVRATIDAQGWELSETDTL